MQKRACFFPSYLFDSIQLNKQIFDNVIDTQIFCETICVFFYKSGPTYRVITRPFFIRRKLAGINSQWIERYFTLLNK